VYEVHSESVFLAKHDLRLSFCQSRHICKSGAEIYVFLLHTKKCGIDLLEVFALWAPNM
jgi:hypothetical protein